MRRLALLCLVLACGAPDVVGTSTPPPPPPAPALPAPMIPAGVYKPAGSPMMQTALSMEAPTGPAPTTTMIKDWGGIFSMVLPSYDYVRGSMQLNADGGLSVGTGNVLVHNDGGVEPANIVGSWDGGTITGTVNDAGFSVSTTGVGSQNVTIAQMLGNYLSTSSNNGLWIALTLSADPGGNPNAGHLQGYAYASQADALSANTARAVGQYISGTISVVDVPANCGGCTATPNTFDFGLLYTESNGTRHPAVSGFAYFTAAGMVALSAQPSTGDEISAVFAKQ